MDNLKLEDMLSQQHSLEVGEEPVMRPGRDPNGWVGTFEDVCLVDLLFRVLKCFEASPRFTPFLQAQVALSIPLAPHLVGAWA